MVYTVVKFLLDNLTELQCSQPDLIVEAEPELSRLCFDLTEFKDLVEKTYKQKQTNEAFKVWEEKIETAIYEVEEIVDTLVTKAIEKRSQGVFGKISLISHRSIGSLKNYGVLGKMQHISVGEKHKSSWKQDLIKLIATLKEEFAKLPPAQEEGSDASEELVIMDYIPFQAPRQDIVVGLEDELDILVGYLEEETNELEVISITGMSGIGKTTMARRIFNDPRIIKKFPTRIWETITRDSNIKDVFLSIVKVFTKQDMSNKSVHELGLLIHDYLEMGKFFIIMDDVETIEAWEVIEKSLPKSNKKGKVLITTTQKNVSVSAKCTNEPHKLRHLNVDESWDLLRLQVFDRINNYHKRLEPVGKLIAKNSKGFPLSVLLIGGVLLSILSQTESKEISEIEKTLEKVAKEIGTDYPLDNIQDQVENLIRWSYITLPRDLRNCFMYLGMLPARTQIPVTKLIQLWVAEGFVIQNKRNSLDEAARQNLMELINRNLLMVNKIKIGGGLKTCRVHDMMHEFCKKEVGKGKWKLFQELSKPTLGELEPTILDMHYKRRLCIHSHMDEFVLKIMDASKVRSLLCFSKFPIILDPKDNAYLGNTWKMIRVLEATSIKLPRFPVKITQLVHLRYITMWCDEFNILPEAFSNLFNLHTLVVRTLSRTVEVKADIWKLMNLRHFKTKASILLKEDGGEVGRGGQKLRKLSKLAAESFTEDVIERAKNLKQLGIFGAPQGSMAFDKLEFLDKLILEHDDFIDKPNKSHKAMAVVGLPPANKFPPKLRFLVLSGTLLDWKHMSTVGNIHTLQVLKLKNNAFKGDSWDVSADDGFSRLETLTIAQADLMFWTVPVNAFPKLITLELDHCETLEEIPLELGKTLKNLSMNCVTTFAVSYAQKMKHSNGGLNLQVYLARN